MFGKLMGPLFIAIAAFLWATDTLFRVPSLTTLSPVFIVLVEHLIGVLALFFWMLFRHRNTYSQLSILQWGAAILIGGLGSSLATILFTASFQYINPSVAILLQKLQPIVVVTVAALILREKIHATFLLWALVALMSALVLSFPDLNFSFLRGGLDIHSRGIFYALCAAVLWGLATVMGKILLKGIPASVGTFWRYVFGLATTAVLLQWGPGATGWEALSRLGELGILMPLLYMGLVPGVLAMLFYYSGLSRSPASVATFVELVFPVSAIALNTIVLNTPLNVVQVGAAGVLLLSITSISFTFGQNRG